MQSTIRSPGTVRRPLDLEVGVIYTHEQQWMPRLLASLAPSAAGLRSRLILVDNASAEGVEDWEDRPPHTFVLHNPWRLHYAANMNRILQASTGAMCCC